MKLLVAILMLSTPLAALSYWFTGVCGGFQLSSKLPPKVKRALKVYGMLTMLSGGAAVGVAGARGCISIGGLAAAAAEAAASPAIQTRIKLATGIKDSHSLGTLASPSPQLLRRLREQDARERKREREIQRQMQAQQQAVMTFSRVVTDAQLAHMAPMMITTTSGRMVEMKIEPRGTRKGPFCRITCTVHHDDHYDVEVETKFCERQAVPADALEVWGWAPFNDHEEYFNPWPGPAVAGFHTYKLYWTKSTHGEESK